ncbi:MAG: hypothetical protein ACYDCC_14025 [Actinomycetota bacterium]
MRSTRKARSTNLLLLTSITVVLLAGVVPAQAVTVNSLSMPGTLGRIRLRPVFQQTSGATALQQGDPSVSGSNPNRTIGDDVIPLTFNTPGPRFLGVNPFATDGHAHYHAGDTQILVNDVSGFHVGDTVLIGSPYCNFPYLGLSCKRSAPAVDETPPGQVNYIVGGDFSTTGPGIIDLAYGLVGSNYCFKQTGSPCAVDQGTQIAKLPTLYQGQQFRVDIAHVDVVNGSAHNVNVTADLVPPQGAIDPNYPRTHLPLSRDASSSFTALVPAACGSASPPPSCGAGFVSFYVPSDITGTATRGLTFGASSGDDWYTVFVTATDAVTGAVVSDGMIRFKLNSVAITALQATPSTVTPTQAVTISGQLRDNSNVAALSAYPVEDVTMDVNVGRPDGMISSYETTSCVNVHATGPDSCGGDIFDPSSSHGDFSVRVGGLSGLFVGFPNVFTSRLNCDAGKFNPLIPSTYQSLLNVPACVLRPVVSATDTTEPGTYDVAASVRGAIPEISRLTSFDVVP